MVSSVVLITGAATGIGNLTARALAADGHTVYASVLDMQGRNARHANDLREFGRQESLDLRVVELDVLSEDSAEAAVAEVIAGSGRIDTVVHNAGHLFLGYVESFTPDEINQVMDLNVTGIQRVNRAVLPYLRPRRSGTLVYVSSTTLAVVPPFMGPYVASKFAADALAQATAYEVAPLGIETTIVMPGPFMIGTDHFPNATHGSDTTRNAGYADLDALVARNDEAHHSLFDPEVEAHPRAVAEEITRILALPRGTRPLRSIVDFTHAGVEQFTEVSRHLQADYVGRLGFEQLLHVNTQEAEGS